MNLAIIKIKKKKLLLSEQKNLHELEKTISMKKHISSK
jgi:hypothetical protein